MSRGWWGEGQERGHQIDGGHYYSIIVFNDLILNITEHPFRPILFIVIATDFQGKGYRFQILAVAWQDSKRDVRIRNTAMALFEKYNLPHDECLKSVKCN